MKSDMSKRMIENSVKQGLVHFLIHSFNDTFMSTCYMPGIELDKGNIKTNRKHALGS